MSIKLHPVAVPAPVHWPELRDFRLECGAVLARPEALGFWNVDKLGLPELSSLQYCGKCLRACEASDPSLLMYWFVLAESAGAHDTEVGQ